MANPAILCLLATLSLLSGCLGGSSEVEAEAQTMSQSETQPAPGETAPTPAALPPPDCPKGGQNNYGTWTQVGDEYVVSPYSGNLVVYYRESNGCSGLQSEDEWGHNPDTKIVEVPYPLLDETAPSAKA